MTFDEARNEIVKSTRHIYELDEATNIAELLLEKITKLTRSERVARRSDVLLTSEKELLQTSICRLREFEPVQYVINESWFAGLRFYVDRNVLIPRPETEELIEWIVSDCRLTTGRSQLTSSRFQIPNLRFLDVGTGSGCIAIALKNKLRDIEMWACDLNDDALNVARLNADVLHATIDFVALNFLDPNQRRQLPSVDVIVSNPPYVPRNEKASMRENVVRYEPSAALFVPDNDPLVFYKAIAAFGREKLNKGGCIYVEIHEDYGEQTKYLFLSEGYQTVQLKKDLQEKDRMIKAVN